MSLKHTLQCIADAPLVTDPFYYMRLANVFPDEFYKLLIKYLPDTDEYQEFIHPDAVYEGKSSRLRFMVEKKWIENLRNPKSQEVMEKLRKTLASDKFRHALFSRFAPDLATKHDVAHDKIKCAPSIFLFRDLKNYKIRIHPDTSRKVVTVLLYLPKDDSHPELGTVLYKEKADPPNKDVRRDPTNFDILEKAPYVPNSGVSFAVTDRSWHSVDTVEEEVERNVLMILYYMK